MMVEMKSGEEVRSLLLVERGVGWGMATWWRGFEVIVTSQIDSFRASMRTVVLIRVILELILRV